MPIQGDTVVIGAGFFRLFLLLFLLINGPFPINEFISARIPVTCRGVSGRMLTILSGYKCIRRTLSRNIFDIFGAGLATRFRFHLMKMAMVCQEKVATTW